MVQSNGEKRRDISERVVIATATFYNPDSESDSIRAVAAKKLVGSAVDLGYEIVVVDGGSSDELLNELERYGAKLFSQEKKGMGSSRKQAFREAYNIGRDVIAWTEPEKESYIPEIIKTSDPIISGSADLVVPRRRSLGSYPTLQQHAESFGNAFWKELTHCDLDVCFGPRTWRRELSGYFLDYDGAYGDEWDVLYIPIIDAIFDKKRVVGAEVDYIHPRELTIFEEGNIDFSEKRLYQLNNVIPALKSHWEKIHKE